VSAGSEILFISDLHLDQDHPGITEQFLNFLETRALQARVLYILGDLFEVWLGDDDPAPQYQSVFEALRHYSKSADVYFQHGNRDFLLGEQLANSLGMTIIDDPCVIELEQHRVALMHGDLLCTDDVDYQNFRRLVRNPDWQREFLAKPLSERQAIANGLREKSGAEMQQKQADIMDVNQTTVLQIVQQLDVDVLIHGHTHRPGIHELGNSKQRLVLGDWQPEPSYISWQQEEFKLVDLRAAG
jgi:UDP-2,3-diacylglucosamine hydrolase